MLGNTRGALFYPMSKIYYKLSQRNEFHYGSGRLNNNACPLLIFLSSFQKIHCARNIHGNYLKTTWNTNVYYN